MTKPLPKNIQKILEKPYAVKTRGGEFLVFADRKEAIEVSYRMGWMYHIFLIKTRSWVPVGIMTKENANLFGENSNV